MAPRAVAFLIVPAPIVSCHPLVPSDVVFQRLTVYSVYLFFFFSCVLRSTFAFGRCDCNSPIVTADYCVQPGVAEITDTTILFDSNRIHKRYCYISHRTYVRMFQTYSDERLDIYILFFTPPIGFRIYCHKYGCAYTRESVLTGSVYARIYVW